MAFKFNQYTLITFILIISLFFGSFIFQYAALIVVTVLLLIISKAKFKYNYTFHICAGLTFIAFISYVYNLQTGYADVYSIIFWMFGYLPNFLLILVALTLKSNVKFDKVYLFYKGIVFLQSVLCLVDVIRFEKIIVGDLATGTLGDANFLAFHFCVILLFEVTTYLANYQNETSNDKHKLYKVSEIFYWLFILLIPESTANLGFLLISLGLFFFFEIIIKKFSPVKILLISVSGILFLAIFINSFVFVRFQEVYNLLDTDKPALKHPYFNKFLIYQKVLSGEVYEVINPLIGSGPSTFTSRSSIMRIKELRYNAPPVEVPRFKSEVVDKFVDKIIKTALESSYGNFGSPQTSVISVMVELGILGFLLFVFLFYKIFSQIKKQKRLYPDKINKLNFIMYFSVFFILNLFFLNMWEYPIYSFTYFLFVFLIL